MKIHTEPEHNRTQFQIDRLAFFSDAVIAIGLTLMILEIKIPAFGKEASVKQIFDVYGWKIFFHVVALFLGFNSIGNLWMQHHKLFEHIYKYNDKLIRINLYFLFTVMMLPISISFLFTENEPTYFKFLVYFSNLFLCSFSYGLMLSVIFSMKNQFSSLKDPKLIRELKTRSYLSALMFLIAVILLLFRVSWWYYSFFLMPLIRVYTIVKNRFFKSVQPVSGL